MCIMGLCTHDSSCQRRPKVSDPGIGVAGSCVSCLIWVLGLIPGSVARAESAGFELGSGSQAQRSRAQAASTGPGGLSNRSPSSSYFQGQKTQG